MKFLSKTNKRMALNSNRFITIPNIITLWRLFLLIPLGYFLLESKFIHALIIYFFIVTSDLADGFIARKFKQKTKFGNYLRLT